MAKKLLLIALLIVGCDNSTEPEVGDCAGVAGGTAVEDDCGDCNGNNAAMDACGVCNAESENACYIPAIESVSVSPDSNSNLVLL